MRTRQVDTAPAVSHRGYFSLKASRPECRFVSSGPEHGSSWSCLPNFSESPQQCSPQQSSCPRDVISAPAQGLAQLDQQPVLLIQKHASLIWLWWVSFLQDILASFTWDTCICTWWGVCSRDKGTTGLKAECSSSLKSCCSDWEHRS